MFEADQLQFVREGNQISVQISSSGYHREQLELIKEYCPVEIVQKDGVLSLHYIIPEYFKTVKEEILAAIKRAYSKEFEQTLKDTINPYDGGNPSKKIVKILKEIKLEGILKKKFYDIGIK